MKHGVLRRLMGNGKFIERNVIETRGNNGYLSGGDYKCVVGLNDGAFGYIDIKSVSIFKPFGFKSRIDISYENSLGNRIFDSCYNNEFFDSIVLNPIYREEIIQLHRLNLKVSMYHPIIVVEYSDGTLGWANYTFGGMKNVIVGTGYGSELLIHKVDIDTILIAGDQRVTGFMEVDKIFFESVISNGGLMENVTNRLSTSGLKSLLTNTSTNNEVDLINLTLNTIAKDSYFKQKGISLFDTNGKSLDIKDFGGIKVTKTFDKNEALGALGEFGFLTEKKLG